MNLKNFLMRKNKMINIQQIEENLEDILSNLEDAIKNKDNVAINIGMGQFINMIKYYEPIIPNKDLLGYQKKYKEITKDIDYLKK